MKITNSITRSILLIIFLSISSTLFAQRVWLRDDQSFISYEFLKPSLEGDLDVGFFAGAHHILGVANVGGSTYFVGNIGFANASYDIDFFDESVSETTITNPYFGLRWAGEDKVWSNEIGVVIPLISDDKFDAATFGILSNPSLIELYVPDTWTVKYSMKMEKPIKDNGVFYYVKGGLSILHNTEAEEDNTALYLDYGGQISYRTDDNLNLYAQLDGRVGLNDAAEIGIDDKTLWFFGLGASYKANRFEPGLSLKFPMDMPFKDLVNNTLAISFVYHFE